MAEDKKGKRKSALGRGLGALLDDSTSQPKTSKLSTDITAGGSVNEITLSSIEVNPFQPRNNFQKEALEELAESIRVQGIIQPITVRKLNDRKYQLISGERRYQASKLAGLKSIPAYVRTANDQQMLEMSLIENIQRENLNAIEIALSYQRLMSECHLKQEDLGDRVGKKRSTVANYLRLLKLPPDIQAGIKEDKISMGHARALISMEKIDDQLDLYQKILANDLNVRQVEALVRQKQARQKAEPVAKPKQELPHELRQLQDKLSSHFGTRITIKNDKGHRGDIRIPFLSFEDLNRILEILNL
jgi:ParB family chromosome partitioning protein